MEREAKVSYGDLLKQAFRRRAHIPFLGRLPLNPMALAIFGVAGIANPGFWLLGLGLELAFVFGLASSARFQKLVEAERLEERRRAWGERLRASVQRLESADRARYDRLVESCRLVAGVAEELQLDSLGDFKDLRGKGLNQLLAIFLRLLLSREAIVANLAEVDTTALETEIGNIEARVAAAQPDSPLARSLKGTLDIQRRRLDNRARAEQSLAVIDAELERIEQQVALLHEEGVVGGRPELLSGRLDAVAATMSETNRWMEDNAELLGSLGDPLLAEAAPALAVTPETEKEG